MNLVFMLSSLGVSWNQRKDLSTGLLPQIKSGGGLQSKPTYHQKTVIYNGAIARFKSKIRTVICRL